MTQATPEWAELLQVAVDNALLDAHTAMPGQIVSVYADASSRGQLVDVRPCLRHALATDADPDATAPFVEEDLPILARIPVAYPQGAGFAITWPLAVGDFVLLVFAERSIRYWLATAIKTHRITSSCDDIDAHTLDGAIALPLGPAPLGELLNAVTATDMVLGHQSGLRIFITRDKLQLGSNSTADGVISPVARDDKVFTELTRIAADLTRLVAATSTAIGAVPGGGTAKTAFDLAIGSTAPTETKVPSTPSHVGSDNVTTS